MRYLCAENNAAAVLDSWVVYLLGQQAPLHMADSCAQALRRWSKRGPSSHVCDLADLQIANFEDLVDQFDNK